MRGLITTDKKLSLTQSLLQGATALALAGVIATPAAAQGQMEGILEEIVVTAQRREERLEDVPISLSTMDGENLASILAGGEDVRALAGRIPGLNAESSNGRVAPRFYLRGLGNTDFDLAASQPVSIIMDEVVMENVILGRGSRHDELRSGIGRQPQRQRYRSRSALGLQSQSRRLDRQQLHRRERRDGW
jgi:iron complex outermembrane receptor protein